MWAEHPSQDRLVALLYETLTPVQEMALKSHLRNCPHCLQDLARLHRSFFKDKQLPPPTVYHPLEVFMYHVFRGTIFPIWLWNLVLYALIYIIWVIFVDMSRVYWLQDPWKALWPQIPIALGSSYFYFTLPKVRSIVVFLWKSGIPYDKVRQLSIKGVFPIFGYFVLRIRGRVITIDGRVTMLFLLFVAQVLFWILSPNMYPNKDEIIAQIFLLYDHQVRAASIWAIIWGVVFIVRVANMINKFPLHSSECYLELQKRMRSLVFVSLCVSAIILSVWTPLTIHKEGRWPLGWGEMNIFLMFLFFSGYLFMEWKLIYPRISCRDMYWKVYTVGGAAVTAIVIIGAPLVFRVFV